MVLLEVWHFTGSVLEHFAGVVGVWHFNGAVLEVWHFIGGVTLYWRCGTLLVLVLMCVCIVLAF